MSSQFRDYSIKNTNFIFKNLPKTPDQQYMLTLLMKI